MHIQEITEHFSLDRIVPYFQPIMDLRHDAVWRYECLARLVTPSEQTFLPSQFLQVVERQQSVEQLTETIFHRSAEYFRHHNMAWNINICEADMVKGQLLSMIGEFAPRYPNASRISLELTAETALANMPAFEQFLSGCHRLNIGVFIDHFGATPGNINHILDLPVSGIKIAGALITQLHDNPETCDFVAHLRAQAADKGVTVVAEHIEDKATLDKIRDLSISFAQGFYFAQPSAET